MTPAILPLSMCKIVGLTRFLTVALQYNQKKRLLIQTYRKQAVPAQSTKHE